MPRLPFPSDTDDFSDETRSAVRHIQETRGSMPPPSSYLTYAGQAGARLSDLVEYLRYHTSLTPAELNSQFVPQRALPMPTSFGAHMSDWVCRRAPVRKQSMQSIPMGHWMVSRPTKH